MKQNLKPGLNPELAAIVERITLDRYRELYTRDQDGEDASCLTDAEYAELDKLRPFFEAYVEKKAEEESRLLPAPHRCLPEPISTAWEDYDEEDTTRQ